MRNEQQIAYERVPSEDPNADENPDNANQIIRVEEAIQQPQP
jgi:hypothetical protein